MPTRIKFTTNFQTFFTNFNSFCVRNCVLTNFIGKCFSKLNHVFTMLFFDGQVWKNLFAKIKKSVSSCDPCINRAFIFSFGSPSIACGINSIKCIHNPFNKNGVGIINLETATMMFSDFSIVISSCLPNVKTSLSVNNSSHVSQIGRFVNFSYKLVGAFVILLSLFFHVNSFHSNDSVKTIHCKLNRAERLSGLDPSYGVCESLSSRGNLEREIRRVFPASNEVTKVTECLNEAAKRLGVSLRATEDQLTRDMLAATASFINCTAGVNGDNPTEITRTDVDTVVRALLNNDAYTILDNIEGDDKFGTAPVRDAYFALASTQLSGNLDAVVGFVHKNQYPAPKDALRSEWGSIGNLRFLLSSAGSMTASGSNLGANVYNMFCVGMEAFACIEQDGYSAQFIYRPPIYDGPLALNCSVGYKFAEVPRITNDLWVINLRATLA